jgi:diadenylate cyclase
VQNFINEVLFLLQRLNWLSIIDLCLVTLVFYVILLMLRDTQALLLLRGVIFLLLIIALMTTVISLPAFSWLITTTLPALLLAIPVIFAPEIRRGLERLGRAGTPAFGVFAPPPAESMKVSIRAVVEAAARLSARQHGALIILQRRDDLWEYARTGVQLNSVITPETLIQIFYPNTPLHDGAVLISGNRIMAAACVMPLSASGILNPNPERQMGLRHRAALGISEATDAIAVVVSEQTGAISVAHGGRMIRRLDTDRLENVLIAFYQMENQIKQSNTISTLLDRWIPSRKKEK